MGGAPWHLRRDDRAAWRPALPALPLMARRDAFAELTAPANLLGAVTRTVRGKRRRAAVASFLLRADAEVAALRAELLAERWRPEPLKVLRVRDPKPRIIARPTVRDRVLHTAVVQVLAPRFEPTLMPEDFACRVGLGAHRAVLRLRALQRTHRFALHLDVRAFFPSIDPERLQALVARRVPDDRMLAVLDVLLAQGPPLYQRPDVRRFAQLTADWPPPGRGVPMGTAVSQFLACHVYLNALDHHVKRALKVPSYVRYCDDLFLFGDRRADLRRWRSEVGAWLAEHRGLRLKHPAARVLSCAGHLDALGYRLDRHGQRARPRVQRRLRARVAEAMHGADGPDIVRSTASLVGVLAG